MKILALDLSLTASGVAYVDGSTGTFLTRSLRGMERLDRIREEVVDYVDERHVDLVVIEGYSFNSRQGGEHLGELGGVIRWSLWKAGTPYVDVAPACLKKYATGKGNAAKEVVLGAAIRRLDFGRDDHNQADALWLRAMALDHYGHPVVTVPAAHREALVKVAWPDLGEPSAA